MKSLFKFAALALSASLLFFSCATTKITETWKDDGYRGAPFSDLFVIGVAKEETTRRSFENKFVEKLQAAGVQAVASSSVMQSDQKIEKTAILAAIEKLDIDAVLVTRLVSLKRKRYVARRRASMGDPVTITEGIIEITAPPTVIAVSQRNTLPA